MMSFTTTKGGTFFSNGTCRGSEKYPSNAIEFEELSTIAGNNKQYNKTHLVV